MRRTRGVTVLAVMLLVTSACTSDASGGGDVSGSDDNDLADTDASDTDAADESAVADESGQTDASVDSSAADESSDVEGSDGFDDGRREQTAEIFAAYDADGPGCVVGVTHAGEPEVMAFGMADLDTSEPLSAASIFDIGSVSKQFTAGAIALLVGDGQLALDAEISSILDIEPFDAEVSVSDLVHHTSGLPDYTELLDAEDDEVTTNGDVVDLVADDDFDLAFDPGTAFEYSNTNYVLLSETVAAVSGESLVNFSAARIFEPLNMSDSVVRDDQGDLLVGQAQGYSDDSGDWTPVGSSWRQTGDGAIHATIPDLLRWAELFLPGSGDVGDGLGSSEWQQQMLEPGEVDDNGSEYAFGIGVEDGGNILAHAGSWIGYSSALTMQPSAEVAVAVSCNIDDIDADELSRQVLAVWV